MGRPVPARTSAGIKIALPLGLEFVHRLIDRFLPGPYALESLGEEVAARVDREVRAGEDRYFARRRKRHSLDEGTADAPGMTGGLVVGLVQDRLPRRSAAALSCPELAVVGEPFHGVHRRLIAARVALDVELHAA